MMPDNQEHEALAEAERELRRISTIVDDEDAGLLSATADRAAAALAAREDTERPAQSDVCGVRGCMRVPGHESSHSIEDGW